MIELLVVVLIILVLASFAFAGAKQAITRANVSKSVSQLRVAGNGILIYKAENDNRFPFSASSGGGTPYWSDIEQVGMYLPNPKSVRLLDYRGETPKFTPVLRDPLLAKDRHNHLSDFGVNGAVLIRSTGNNLPLKGTAVSSPSQVALIMTAEMASEDPPCGNWYVNTDKYVKNTNEVQCPSDRGTGFVYTYFSDGHTQNIPLKEMRTNAAAYLKLR